MMATKAACRVLRCPCGGRLFDVSQEATGMVEIRCPHCRALLRVDLPTGYWTIEESPKGR